MASSVIAGPFPIKHIRKVKIFHNGQQHEEGRVQKSKIKLEALKVYSSPTEEWKSIAGIAFLIGHFFKLRFLGVFPNCVRLFH